MPIPAPVAAVRQAGGHGAKAEVTMAGRDADILTKMGSLVLLLHAMAREMNEFAGLSDDTRKCIRECRNLATLLQEEYETRLGPR